MSMMTTMIRNAHAAAKNVRKAKENVKAPDVTTRAKALKEAWDMGWQGQELPKAFNKKAKKASDKKVTKKQAKSYLAQFAE
jgi:hypothetical protein